MYNGGFGVILREADKRMLHFRVFACLIFSVKRVDILDELAVQQVERNVFGAYSRAFAAVGASASYMETRMMWNIFSSKLSAAAF